MASSLGGAWADLSCQFSIKNLHERLGENYQTFLYLICSAILSLIKNFNGLLSLQQGDSLCFLQRKDCRKLGQILVGKFQLNQLHSVWAYTFMDKLSYTLFSI